MDKLKKQTPTSYHFYGYHTTSKGVRILYKDTFSREASDHKCRDDKILSGPPIGESFHKRKIIKHLNQTDSRRSFYFDPRNRFSTDWYDTSTIQ